MRVLVVVKATKESEAGAMPDAALIAQMGQFNDELIAAGMMLDGAGLRPSSTAKRIDFSGSKATVTDGPFAETKALIAGYWIWNVKDFDEATAWASRAPMGDGAQLELRQFFEPEDFEGIATPELIAQEKGWRDEAIAKAPKAD